nr:sensor domain-containing protein [Micromonospora humida]
MRRYAGERIRAAVDALEDLVGGLTTAVLAIGALLCLLIVLVSSILGVGILLIPGALRVVRSVADRERLRLSRWGPEILSPPRPPTGPWPGCVTRPYVVNSSGCRCTPPSVWRWACSG